MANLAITKDPSLLKWLKENKDKLLITSYGDAHLFQETVLIRGVKPFPLFETLVPLSFINIRKEEEAILKQLKECIKVEDELEKMFIASQVMNGSRRYGTSFSNYLDVVVSILDYFSDEGIEKATFRIRERWEGMTGDLLDRWFEVLDYQGSEIGVSTPYSFAFVRLSDVPLELQKMLREYNLYSDTKFIGIYEDYGEPQYTLVAVIQNNPLDLDNIPQLWNDSFEAVGREEESILEKFDKYLRDFKFLDKDLLSLASEIRRLKYLNDLNILSILRLIKIRLKLQKEKENKFGELEKVLDFQVSKNKPPFFFDVEIIT